MNQITPHLDLLAMIETYIAKGSVSESAFGLKSIGDPNLVRNLRAGRELRRATAQRVMEYMLTSAGGKGAA